MKNLIWLASYPKSGNTWLRVLLDSILTHEGKTVDINQINSTKFGFISRFHLDEFLEINSTELTSSETHFFKRAYYLDFGSKAEEGTFLKTHDANMQLDNDLWLIPKEVTKLVIYITRNPLDIVASFANHLGISLDRTIDLMSNKEFSFFRTRGGVTSNVDQLVTDWSGHVTSWLDSTLPVLLVKYEDLLQAPVETLMIIMKTLDKNKVDKKIIEEAVVNNSFAKMAKQESEKGFHEKDVLSPVFFRKGKANSWEEELTEAQINRVTQSHGKVMTSLGYLPNLKLYRQ